MSFGKIFDYFMKTKKILRSRNNEKSEAGSATVLIAGLSLMAVILALGIAFLFAGVSNYQYVQNQADLTALGAAQSWDGISDPCLKAAEISAEAKLSLVECEVVGELEDFALRVKLEKNWIIGIQVTAIAGREWGWNELVNNS